jgi:magnesium and cobalt transporter
MKEDPEQSILIKFFKYLFYRISHIIKSYRDNELRSKINYLKKNHNKMSLRERYLLRNVIDFSEKNADDVLVSRSEICAVNINVSIEKLFSIIKDTYNTRIIVFENNLDNIKGYIHIKDILVSLIQDNQSIKIAEMIRKPIIASHSTKLTNILIEMQAKSTHIAIILDEYGCTDGIVTFEDIMEVLVGNIEDEHDEKDNLEEFEFLNKNTIISSGKAKIIEIEKAIGIELRNEDDNCDTIGGLVISRFGKLPHKGCIIDITKNVKAKIIETSPKNIKTLNLILNEGFEEITKN